MRKRVISIIMCSVLVLGSVGSVHASYLPEMSDSIINDKIENYKALNNFDAKDQFEIAKKRSGSIPKSSVLHKALEVKEDVISETYTFSDIVYKYGEEEIVAQTTASKVTEIDRPNQPGIGQLGGSREENGYDGSYSVYATVTVYYDTKKANDGETVYRLYRVEVSNRRSDYSVSIINQHLIYGAQGFLDTGRADQQRTVKYPTGSGWSYSTGYSNYYRDVFGLMGAKYTLTLKRQSSYTWNLDLASYVYSKGITY